MKFCYETPVVTLLLPLDAEDVLTASGFETVYEGEGDHIFIDEL